MFIYTYKNYININNTLSNICCQLPGCFLHFINIGQIRNVEKFIKFTSKKCKTVLDNAM